MTYLQHALRYLATLYILEKSKGFFMPKISLRTLCDSPELKTLVTHCRLQNAYTKMSRRSRSFFSELVNATTKRFYTMVNYPLSRELDNIAKIYSIKCSQTTCAKLKKYEFCPVGHGGIAHIYSQISISYIPKRGKSSFLSLENPWTLVESYFITVPNVKKCEKQD